MELKKETLEGILNVGTSPTDSNPNPDAEQELMPEADAEPELNSLSNSTVPTEQEQENANTLTDAPAEAIDEPEQGGDTPADTVLGEEENLITDPNQQAEVNPGLATNQEAQIDGELGLAEASATRTFTQSQVDEIAGKIRKETREKVTRDFFNRYGVNTADELDELFSDAQRFATSQDDFAEKENAWKQADEARNQELTSVKERVALLESGIDKNRFEDARLILRGKGLEVTAENIEAELATHPEWKKENLPAPTPVEEAGLPFAKVGNPVQPEPKPATKISIPTLGNNSADNPQPELSERERALKMFKV